MELRSQLNQYSGKKKLSAQRLKAKKHSKMDKAADRMYHIIIKTENSACTVCTDEKKSLKMLV